MNHNKYVIEIKEEICTQNGCWNKVGDLLKLLPKYGKLTTFDAAVQEIVDDKQATIDSLMEELGKLKAHNITPAEIQFLNLFRAHDAETQKELIAQWEAEKAQLIAAKNESDNQVVAMKNEFHNYKRRLRSFVGDEDK